MEYIRDYVPDAMILDLELHFGSGSGLQLLNDMQTLKIPYPPYILITTNNSSTTTYEYARQLGADYIMYKHQQDYSPANVIEFLGMMKNVIQNRTPPAHAGATFEEPPIDREKRIMRRITSELNLIGISTKAVGYQYLVDAILLVIKQPTPKLCTIIGEKYGKTESSVERAMQNAICRAWRSSDIDDLLCHYTARIKSDKGVPTLTEFIYYYANKLKLEY